MFSVCQFSVTSSAIQVTEKNRMCSLFDFSACFIFSSVKSSTCCPCDSVELILLQNLASSFRGKLVLE